MLTSVSGHGPLPHLGHGRHRTKACLRNLPESAGGFQHLVYGRLCGVPRLALRKGQGRTSRALSVSGTFSDELIRWPPFRISGSLVGVVGYFMGE